MDHLNANHLGYYDPRTDCPVFAEDFNCLRPYPPAQADEDLAAKEYRKVPFLAQLLMWIQTVAVLALVVRQCVTATWRALQGPFHRNVVSARGI